MSETFKSKASCMCGAVSIKAKQISKHLGACHCTMCRKWGGGPLLAVDCQSDVLFTGEEHITRYHSSDWAERGFCCQCGSHLFYRLKDQNKYIIPAGLFDEQHLMFLDHQVFIDEKPSYYSFSNETKNMTGEELFAQFAPESQHLAGGL